MSKHSLSLQLLPGTLAVCRLGPADPVPDWAWTGEPASVTRTREETSIICAGDAVPAGVVAERGYRCLRVGGTLVLDLTGVIASLAAPLAAAGVPIFPFATYDTDWILVKEENLERAVEALRAAGHTVEA